MDITEGTADSIQTPSNHYSQVYTRVPIQEQGITQMEKAAR